jgi:pyruvate dehydrogenase phosphatase
MRRAAVQALRLARRPILRKSLRHNSALVSPSDYALGLRALSSRRASVGTSILHSSMQIRNFSVALVSAGVLSGAWYYRQAQQNPLTSDSPSASPSNAYSSSALADSTVAAEPSTRRALVVEQGNLFTGTIQGSGPISDESGRKVLEMMTPDQVTQKLRKNEESYVVGRGAGVVRYDVVQIPSNDPIEDDHAEKIIEVPQSVAATENGAPSSDWMFWGVFDGHRSVSLTTAKRPGTNKTTAGGRHLPNFAKHLFLLSPESSIRHI